MARFSKNDLNGALGARMRNCSLKDIKRSGQKEFRMIRQSDLMALFRDLLNSYSPNRNKEAELQALKSEVERLRGALDRAHREIETLRAGRVPDSSKPRAAEASSEPVAPAPRPRFEFQDLASEQAATRQDTEQLNRGIATFGFGM